MESTLVILVIFHVSHNYIYIYRTKPFWLYIHPVPLLSSVLNFYLTYRVTLCWCVGGLTDFKLFNCDLQLFLHLVYETHILPCWWNPFPDRHRLFWFVCVWDTGLIRLGFVNGYSLLLYIGVLLDGFLQISSKWILTGVDFCRYTGSCPFTQLFDHISMSP